MENATLVVTEFWQEAGKRFLRFHVEFMGLHVTDQIINSRDHNALYLEIRIYCWVPMERV